jgi:putative membrane protein insertion efficiency factor
MSAKRGPNPMTRAVRAAVLMLIKAYRRLLSPLLPASCRFHQTCSAYALTSVERFGVLRGGWLAAKRIARCHPFNAGGYDPVPETIRPKR